MSSNVGPIDNHEVNDQEVERENDQEVAGSPSSSNGKPKRKRMKDRSEVWEHFLKKETALGLRAVCKYCNMEYKCNPKKNGTSVLWGHISRCRKYPYNTPKDSKQSKLSFKSAKVGEGDGTSTLTYHKYDPATLRKALSFMVIVDELPFKFVEGLGFRFFCNAMEPRFHVPSRITVAKDCFQTFLTEKRKLKNVLKNNNSRVSLTTDSWTSIQQINYMCLTMYEEYRAFSSNEVMREEVSSSKDQTHFSPKHKKIEVLKSKYKKHKVEKEGEAKIELDKYLEEETEDDNDDFDILGWWKFNSARFPTMASMARDVLAVPISTVASESAFSTGGRFLDAFRSSLSPRVVEGLVCAQNWLHASPSPNVEECLEEVEKLEADLDHLVIADGIEQVLVD